LEKTNAIVARPWNDWELGLSLGKWGLVKQGYYLLSQGVLALATLLRRSVAGEGGTRTDRAKNATGSNE